MVRRDGKKLVVGKDMPMPATYLGIDVATKKPLDAGGQPLAGGANIYLEDGVYYLTGEGKKVLGQDCSECECGNKTPNLLHFARKGFAFRLGRRSCPKALGIHSASRIHRLYENRYRADQNGIGQSAGQRILPR